MTSKAGRAETSKSALGACAVAVGEVRASAMNQPVDLGEMGVVWFVERGALDISVAEYAEQGIQSSFRHVLRLQAGHLAFGVGAAAAEEGLKLVGKGVPGTQLRRLGIPLLLKETAGESFDGLKKEIAAAADAWISDFAAAVSREIEPRPRPTALLSAGPAVDLPSEGILFAEREVVWLSGEGLDASFLQLQDAGPDGPGLMPVTRDAWVDLRGAGGVACAASLDLDVGVLLREALPEFHRLALGAEALNRRLRMVDDANLQAAQVNQRRRDESAARQGLAGLMGSRRVRSAAQGHALTAALKAIGRHEGFSIQLPSPESDREPDLQEILAVSRIRARRVRLSRPDRWWLGDSGAMLAFHRQDERPLVLIPSAAGRYRLLDPVSGNQRPASAAAADELLEEAWFFYPALPVGGPVGMKALFRAAGGSVAVDLARLAAAGIGAGLLALAPAVAVNLLVGSVIPSGAAGALAQFTAVFVGVAFAAALAHMLRGTALMRLEGRVAAQLGAAVWDRLLRLKMAFFRDYTSGELAARAMTFQSLRDQVSGIAAEALLSTLFLLPMFGLVFYYNAGLGWLILSLGLAALGLSAAFAVRLVGPQRRYLSLERRLSGDLLQFLRGIIKLRMTGAESSAYAAWANGYREQKRAEIRIAALSEHIAALSAALPAAGSAALFAALLGQGWSALIPADFLAVYAASMVLYMAIASLGQSLKSVAAVVPGCEQVVPILQAETDSSPRIGSQRRLDGEITLQNVSFRYAPDGPAILEDVSLHAGAGEFVAIVGESGSGKSTLFSVALGLEEPLCGAVYYDGKDLADLDGDMVRRQLGVVTQDGSLLGGTVLINIIGVGGDLTEDDAWRAARRASVDKDIAAMPMGMHTCVGENGSNLSGGQNQRIRIAAALVYNPRILFLDEPTCWLDNRSQAETIAGIENAACTRIVIAHRLSTIRNAHRVYVLEAGRVAQVGEFDELMAQDGPFRNLAKRQMV